MDLRDWMSKDKSEAKEGDMERAIEWIWVGGYSTLSTLVLIFNLLILFSVAKNKYLHYTTHYVMVTLALRNLLRVALTLWLVFMAKLVQTPWLLKATLNMPLGTEESAECSEEQGGLASSSCLNLMCRILATLDTVLMASLMFYLAGLSLYMFCRAPNPTIATTSDTTLKIYGLNSSIIPVRERCWVAPLLVLLPPTLAILLALPVPLGMTEPHMMVSMPGDGAQLCTYAPGVSPNEKYGPYQSSVTILGFYLPSAIVICLLIGLSIRRCFACSGSGCVSSYCKEEMVLAFLFVPYLAGYLILHLNIQEHYIGKLELPDLGASEYIRPEYARAGEIGLGLLLPLVLYSTLPAYRKFSSEPDTADLYRSKRDIYQQRSHGEDLSQASLEI